MLVAIGIDTIKSFYRMACLKLYCEYPDMNTDGLAGYAYPLYV